MTPFHGELDVRYVDGRRWLLTAPFTYHLVAKHGPEFVRVDVGTLTDFASIPRPLKLLWPSPGGRWDRPAVIHDELYVLPFIQHIDGSARRIERAEADAIFHEANGAAGVRWVVRQLLYRGVRLGGGVAWGRYRRREAVPA